MSSTIKGIIKKIIPQNIYNEWVKAKKIIIVNRIEAFLLKSDDEEYRRYGHYIKKKGEMCVYYGDWTKKWDNLSFDLSYDDPCFYAEYIPLTGGASKRLYMHEGWDKKRCQEWYKSIVMEQDCESPHCYFNDGFFERNKLYGTVLDIGAAEGNFSISVIDHVDKVYMFEPDSSWESAINKTFKNYLEPKFNWIRRAVSKATVETDGLKMVSIDDFFGDKIPNDISIIKMDIDGFEADALLGMKKTLEINPQAVILATAYHHHADEHKIRNVLEPLGYSVTDRKGYMLFHDDGKMVPPYLKKGVLEAKRKQ